MVIFDENQGVSDLSKYEFHCSMYVKIIKFLALWEHIEASVNFEFPMCMY